MRVTRNTKRQLFFTFQQLNLSAFNSKHVRYLFFCKLGSYFWVFYENLACKKVKSFKRTKCLDGAVDSAFCFKNGHRIDSMFSSFNRLSFNSIKYTRSIGMNSDFVWQYIVLILDFFRISHSCFIHVC